VLEPPGVASATVSFRYFVRPYIPWPPLGEASVSREERARHWARHCEKWRLPKQLANDPKWQRHFFDEALFGGTANPSAAGRQGDRLFLVSQWRWRGM